MELKLVRKYCKEKYTIGHLFVLIDGKWVMLCDTLEDVVRDFNKDGDLLDEGETKVYGQTAIPYGKYTIDMSVSNRFKPRYWAAKYGGIVPLISGVKHFDGTRLHPTITRASETLGCVGVGRNTEVGRLTQTVEIYFYLMDNYLIPAMNRNESITLEIV